MKNESTIYGTWICTGRVYGRLLVSEGATREEAFTGWVELMKRRMGCRPTIRRT